MTTFVDLTNQVLQRLYGFGLAQPRASFLAQPITDTDLTIQVTNAADFSQGIAEIGDEMIYVDTVDAQSSTLTIAPDGRGYWGTTPAAHDANARIESAPVWSRQRVREAINEAILGTYPTLFGVGTTSFTYDLTVTTHELPVDVERVLKVTADTIGPSEEQIQLTRYSVNSVAPTGTFASGNTITLERGPFPGRDVTVTYAKQPTGLVVGDDFTDSGLRETAIPAIKYATCSELIAYMDTARLAVDTATADEFDPSRAGVGTAARISTQLFQRYQIELAQERKRLLAATPTPMFSRKR